MIPVGTTFLRGGCSRGNKTPSKRVKPSSKSPQHIQDSNHSLKLIQLKSISLSLKLALKAHYFFNVQKIYVCSHLFSLNLKEIQVEAYLIFVIFFTQAKFLENKIYTEKTRKLRQNTQKIANFYVNTAKYTVNCQFFALNL